MKLLRSRDRDLPVVPSIALRGGGRKWWGFLGMEAGERREF
jgi:hypothetical protein